MQGLAWVFPGFAPIPPVEIQPPPPGGGGSEVTLTVAVSVSEPPGPSHCKVKVFSPMEVSRPVLLLPDATGVIDPTQLGLDGDAEAVHPVALVLSQVRLLL